MEIKVGIPRGLLYYHYFPLWNRFFETLGAEVVVSQLTNKKIIENGVKHTVDEACLPVKVYHGHVMDLKDKVDTIFVPRIMSVYKNEYICPKFCGLPEMITSSLKDLPPLIDTTINFHKSKKQLYKAIYEIGRPITRNVHQIEMAYTEGLKQYQQYKQLMRKGVLPIDILTQKKPETAKRDILFEQKVILLGHPYNLYDNHLSMNIIKKLREKKVKVITPEMMDTATINQYAEQMDKKMFWSFGRKILGTAFYGMGDPSISGMIYLSSFGCGLDSVIADIVERRVRRNSRKPFTILTLDEHTGEAGIDTRIEAFVDMIKWREKHENNFSSHG
ncbi:MAG: acyl-CoA dehydratase activase-related protein [Thermotaleaceae bacterium]